MKNGIAYGYVQENIHTIIVSRDTLIIRTKVLK